MNRKRNGKRKEYPFSKYNEEKVIFEDEYLNGERNGKEKNITKMENYILNMNIKMEKFCIG